MYVKPRVVKITDGDGVVRERKAYYYGTLSFTQ